MEISRKRARCGQPLPDGSFCRRWATRIMYVKGFGDLPACQRCADAMKPGRSDKNAKERRQAAWIDEVVSDSYVTVTYYEARE